VDAGAVRLISPVLDLSIGAASVSYRYFLRLTNDDGADRLLVEASTHGGGAPWTVVAEHEIDGGLLWRSHEIGPADFAAAGVEPGAATVLRFTANDGDPQSVVEAGLDRVIVTSLACERPRPCAGDLDGDGAVGFGDLVELLVRWGACPTEAPCPADLEGNGAVARRRAPRRSTSTSPTRSAAPSDRRTRRSRPR
jgi:hypothetical protein